MEYVDGTPAKGPLGLEKTMEHARQIASALDAAHSRKITHRDLKPANTEFSESNPQFSPDGNGSRILPTSLAALKSMSQRFRRCVANVEFQ